MRRLRIFMFIALLVLVVGNSIVLPVYAKEAETGSEGYEVRVLDHADLLTDSQETQLQETMRKTAGYCNALFVTSDSVSSSTSEFARNIYRQEFGRQNGVMFLIDMSNREIYVYAYGAAYQTINKTNAYTITDNIYTYASAKQYYECANSAFEQINALLEGGRISRPMKYISNILLALIFSVLLNFWLLKKTSKVPSMDEKNLLEGATSVYDMEEPRFVMLNRRCVMDSDDDFGGGHSGGGGGGSFGGGGGFSGGGGGHSF